MHKGKKKNTLQIFDLMARLWWAELQNTNCLSTEVKHLCTVICASAVVLISSSTIVRGKKKITFCINIYTYLLGTCIICTATLLDKIPTVDTITSEDI